MIRHTPGPWYYNGDESRTIVADRDGDVECPTICDVLDTAEGLEGSDAEADANGRLIASAPELLECLEEIWEWQRGCQDLLPDGLGGKISTVLAEAKGAPTETTVPIL